MTLIRTNQGMEVALVGWLRHEQVPRLLGFPTHIKGCRSIALEWGQVTRIDTH